MYSWRQDSAASRIELEVTAREAGTLRDCETVRRRTATGLTFPSLVVVVCPIFDLDECGRTTPATSVRGIKRVLAPGDMYWGAGVGNLTILTDVPLRFLWLVCHMNTWLPVLIVLVPSQTLPRPYVPLDSARPLQSFTCSRFRLGPANGSWARRRHSTWNDPAGPWTDQ